MAVILDKYFIFAALKKEEFKCFPDLWPEGLLQNPLPTPGQPTAEYPGSLYIFKNCSNLYCSSGMTVLYNQIRDRQTFQESFCEEIDSSGLFLLRLSAGLLCIRLVLLPDYFATGTNLKGKFQSHMHTFFKNSEI